MNTRGAATFYKSVRGHKVCWRPSIKKWARYRRGVWTTEDVNPEAEVLKASDIIMQAATDYSGAKADDLLERTPEMEPDRGLSGLMRYGKGELGRFERFFDCERGFV